MIEFAAPNPARFVIGAKFSFPSCETAAKRIYPKGEDKACLASACRKSVSGEGRAVVVIRKEVAKWDKVVNMLKRGKLGRGAVELVDTESLVPQAYPLDMGRPNYNL